MIRRNDGTLEFYPYKVEYVDSKNDTHVQWAIPSIEWWQEYADRWCLPEKPLKVIDVSDQLTDEQRERLQNVLDNSDAISAQYDSSCIEYITNGAIPLNPKHPLAYIGLVTEFIKQAQLVSSLLINMEELKSKYEKLAVEVIRLGGDLDG